jgi:hypothetical protein
MPFALVLHVEEHRRLGAVDEIDVAQLSHADHRRRPGQDDGKERFLNTAASRSWARADRPFGRTIAAQIDDSRSRAERAIWCVGGVGVCNASLKGIRLS